tara:strand:- start:182 stop:1237 length:1056 start_codon:yes stop_codon:yes gene_type:complete
MAWAVETDGVNDYLVSSTSWVPTDLDNWNLKIRARRLSGTGNRVLFANSDFDDGMYINANTGGSGDNLSCFIGGVPIFAPLTGFNTDRLFHDIEVDCVSGVIELIVDTVSYGTASRGGLSLSRNKIWFGNRAGTSSWMHQQTEYVDLTDSNTPSNSRYYDATASSHAAGTPILTDTIGGNNATGFNMPTDGSAWIDLGGSGVTVTAATANYNYAGVTGSIDLTGEVIVTGQTGNYNYTAITASIELGTEIIVTGDTANYNYLGINGSVELTGLIAVTGQTANYNYAGVAAGIALQGSIVITAGTANYDYNALNATIIIQGPITINPKNIIRVKRNSNTVRVKRNSNIIRVR